MYCDVTVTKDQFKAIHNTLWELQYQGLDGATGAERIREALKGAYEQDQADFDRKHREYQHWQQHYGLSTTWSIYDVNNMTTCHPYQDATHVLYDQHWGGKQVVVEIQGRDWNALYRAADTAIRESGDSHHCFIESFSPVEHRAGYLQLHTGS